MKEAPVSFCWTIDLHSRFLLKIRGLILIIRVLQNAVDQQHIVKTVGVGLTEQGSVEIENRDPAFCGDEIHSALIGDGFHVGDKLLLQFCVLRSEGKRIAFVRGSFLSLIPANAEGVKAAHDQQQTEGDNRKGFPEFQGILFLFHCCFASFLIRVKN